VVCAGRRRPTFWLVSLINKMDGDYSYRQIADSIQQRIATGVYTVRLPAERALADEYGVAYQTLRRSMEVLRDRGMVITRQGRGTFVAPEFRVTPQTAESPDPPDSAEGNAEDNEA
jgi:GntR family transcriptional regulator